MCSRTSHDSGLFFLWILLDDVNALLDVVIKVNQIPIRCPAEFQRPVTTNVEIFGGEQWSHRIFLFILLILVLICSVCGQALDGNDRTRFHRLLDALLRQPQIESAARVVPLHHPIRARILFQLSSLRF